MLLEALEDMLAGDIAPWDIAWHSPEPAGQLVPYSSQELAADVWSATRDLASIDASRRVGIVVRPVAQTIAWLAAGLLRRQPLTLIDPRNASLKSENRADLGLVAWIDPYHPQPFVGLDADSTLEARKNEAIAIMTSGTSGTAKAVCLTLDNLDHNLACVSAAMREFGVPMRGAPWSLVLNAAHAYGLSVLLLSLIHRAPLGLHRDPNFVETVIDEMNQIGTEVLPAVSSFLGLERQTVAGIITSAAVPTLGVRLFAGEGLSKRDVDELIERDSALRIIHMYGMTEHTARVSMGLVGVDYEPGDVGTPLKGVLVSTIPHESSGLDEIVLRSPSLSPGYAHEALRLTDDGMLRTGDLGAIGKNGRLVIRGRVSEHFSFKGISVWARDVEAEVMSIQGVFDCLAEQSRSDEPVKCSVVVDGSVNNLSLQRVIRSRCNPRNLIGEIVFVNHIDRTNSGKRKRKRSSEDINPQD